MKWTTREGGKKVVHEIPVNPNHNPPCRTERCQRRKAKKGKK